MNKLENGCKCICLVNYYYYYKISHSYSNFNEVNIITVMIYEYCSKLLTEHRFQILDQPHKFQIRRREVNSEQLKNVKNFFLQAIKYKRTLCSRRHGSYKRRFQQKFSFCEKGRKAKNVIFAGICVAKLSVCLRAALSFVVDSEDI